MLYRERRQTNKSPEAELAAFPTLKTELELFIGGVDVLWWLLTVVRAGITVMMSKGGIKSCNAHSFKVSNF